MWDLSSPTRDRTLQCKRGVLTTGPPGKSLTVVLVVLHHVTLHQHSGPGSSSQEQATHIWETDNRVCTLPLGKAFNFIEPPFSYLQMGMITPALPAYLPDQW